MKNTNRIKQTDKYDGTDVAKQRLLNLFLFTDMNIKEYCRVMQFTLLFVHKKQGANIMNKIDYEKAINETERQSRPDRRNNHLLTGYNFTVGDIPQVLQSASAPANDDRI